MIRAELAVQRAPGEADDEREAAGDEHRDKRRRRRNGSEPARPQHGMADNPDERQQRDAGITTAEERRRSPVTIEAAASPESSPPPHQSRLRQLLIVDRAFNAALGPTAPDQRVGGCDAIREIRILIEARVAGGQSVSRAPVVSPTLRDVEAALNVRG